MTRDKETANGESGLTKFGKNEGVLLSWRTLVLLLCAGGTGGIWNANGDLRDIKRELADQRREFAAFKDQQSQNRLTDAKELGDLRGRVGGIEGTVEVHRSRIRGLEDDVRGFWTRLLEVAGQQQQPRGPR